MNIIYEDKDKLILYKQAGQLVQSGKGFDTDLVSEVMNYRKRKGEPAYAAVINRLDRPVSGVVLMAKNKESAARYSKIMQQQGFCKQYYALVYGRLEERSGVLEDYLVKTRDNMAVVCGKTDKDAKFAKLEYEVAGELCAEAVSCLKITLHTGRFHQIRAQLSSRGHAIVGDGKYGGDGVLQNVPHNICLKPREIALCAHSIDVDGDEYTVTPEWWSIVAAEGLTHPQLMGDSCS